ncbi:hypothetical protein AMTR_s00044p00125900 [Amborella trichopoda]|uniref:Subtilisin-like protease fibronectin type-III domain-containing protein n=1 Tax=Amborella trichopoda TaxID=13333 RepID=U5D4K1_AMBTC|nr:hypothetical protein AMTR_s00044p00125900 [Amborella trichopoda]
MVPDTITASESDSRMVYAYSAVIDGFAAKLIPAKIESMMTKEGFLHIYPDKPLRLQTTHSPQFLGLSPKDATIPQEVEGVDAGLDFNSSHCNKKLIGAQAFNEGALALKLNVSDSPRDDDGHGAHTATTAAGRFVAGVELLGSISGTAEGTAPLSHLAMYKVCYAQECVPSDILAGLEKAILDGVDVLSISVGFEYFAIGAFEAMRKGRAFFVSCAAGNYGPDEGSVMGGTPGAPWVLTVGASTMDRELQADTKLGNGQTIAVQSLFQSKDFKPTLFSLVHLVSNPNCNGSLSTKVIYGKVLLCELDVVITMETYLSFLEGGGVAMIVCNPENVPFQNALIADILPVSNVNFYDGNKIRTYINSTRNPKAGVVFKGSVFGKAVAPMVGFVLLERAKRTIMTTADIVDDKAKPIKDHDYNLASVFKRTVTNVGDAESSYEVEVVQPVGVSVEVNPTKLSFIKANEKQEYRATFLRKANRLSSHSQGHVMWRSGSKYQLSSPIAVVLSENLNF